MKRSSLKPGKKTKEWARVRAKLKPRFEAAGITHCEFGFPGCWNNDGLSYAHIDKRRFLEKGELEKAALACLPCHDYLEHLPRFEMRAIIELVIAKRKVQP